MAAGKTPWSWRSRSVRGLAYQVLALALIVAAAAWLAHNTLVNMAARGIQSGFDFLLQPAGFDIGERLFDYESVDPYWQAFAVGLLNTLRAAACGIVLATLLGLLLGLGRFSRNALLRGLCRVYVEVFRNVPVLLQLLMWYLLFVDLLPPAPEAFTLGPAGAEWLRLSKNGLSVALPAWQGGQGLVWSLPRLDGFMLTGGMTATPEFLAVLTGLTLYTAAFIGEIVRSGIAA
ncbi:MAG TPA: ABC transporter permease subunit, partial [Burkholderiaceae bacterium]